MRYVEKFKLIYIFNKILINIFGGFFFLRNRGVLWEKKQPRRTKKIKI